MNRPLARMALPLLVLLAGCAGPRVSEPTPQDGWRDTFDVGKKALSSTGRGTYVVLEPGATWTYSDREEQLVITVLDETRTVDGVVTRVVEERETVNGALKEVSRNFMAIHPATGDVYYFGEEVDMYKDGRVSSHEGAWESGRDGARFGLLVPGSPRVGQKYYQEIAEGVAMDRAEVVSVSARETTPVGRFDGVLMTRETSPLERGTSRKWYAPGVGLIRDDDFVLTSFSLPGDGTR